MGRSANKGEAHTVRSLGCCASHSTESANQGKRAGRVREDRTGGREESAAEEGVTR